MEKARRGQIDESRVRELSERLESSRAKKSDFERQFGQVEGRIQELEEQFRQQQEVVDRAERRREAELRPQAQVRSRKRLARAVPPVSLKGSNRTMSKGYPNAWTNSSLK